jgi:hypothetical protein
MTLHQGRTRPPLLQPTNTSAQRCTASIVSADSSARERLLQLTQHAAIVLLRRATDPTVDRVQDAVERLAQRLAVRGEQEHRGGEHSEDREMYDPVQSDQGRRVPVPQRTSTQRLRLVQADLLGADVRSALPCVPSVWSGDSAGSHRLRMQCRVRR